MRRLKFSFDEESLTKEVNKCDKYLGVKVKKHDAYSEPEQVFGVACAEAQSYIAKLITVINGIDPDAYFSTSETYGTVSGPIGPKNIEFTELSDLEWEKNNKYEMNTLIFKCRFLTAYLQDIMCSLEKISMNRYYKSHNKFGPYEHSYFYLKDLLADIQRLCLCMINGNDYSNILMKNLMHSSYLKKKVNSKKLNKTIYAAITELRTGVHPANILTEDFMSDDMVIYSLLRIAYMLSTNDLDLENIPSFEYIEGATREHDLIRLIEELGSSILIEHKYKKRPSMYKAFNTAEPLIMTNYSNVNDDLYLSIGIRALVYADFIINDKKIHKFVMKMINKGKYD
jgi:hypothetical protein